MANFNIPYTTPGNYTYNASEIEVAGGVAKLKEDLSSIYARWHLNESSGTNVPDDSGNTRDGTTQNMEDGDWGAGKLNNGLTFGGTDEYVECGSIARFERTDAFSVECHAKWTNTASAAFASVMLTSTGRGWLFFTYLGKIWVMLRTNVSFYMAVSTNIDTFADNAYHHIVMTYDGSDSASGIKIYVDDSLQSVTVEQDDLNGTIVDSATCQIGGRDGSDMFIGSIDEVVIYDRVITSGEVTHRYNSGVGREDWIYYLDKPTVELTSLFDPASVMSWDSFAETLGGNNQGLLGYNLYKVDKANKYYWNGSAWVTGGSSSNYNTVATINTNIGTFDASPDKIGIVAYLISNGYQQVEIDLNQITYADNQSPNINAGTNKSVKDNKNLSPFSDCSFSDPDGTVDKAYYKVDGEVDIWTEILIGGYGTLLEAVQAFSYQFNNTGVLTVRLQVEDDMGATSDDFISVTVTQYTKAISIKDASTSEHLDNVLFDPGDGSGATYKSSPFVYSWDYSTITLTMDKQHYNYKTQEELIDDETDLNLVLEATSILDICRASVGFLTEVDEVLVTAWLEKKGSVITSPVSCEVWLYDHHSNLKYNPPISYSPNSDGVFDFHQTPSNLPDEEVYILKISIVEGAVTYTTIIPVGQMKRDFIAFIDGAVYINVDAGETGVIYPKGIYRRPVDNLADALTIMDANKLNKIKLLGTLTISESVAGDYFQGLNSVSEVILTGSNAEGAIFRDVIISGVSDNKHIHIFNSEIKSLTNFSGELRGCHLEETVVLGGSTTVHMFNCYSRVPGVSTPIVDMGGSGRGLGVRGQIGGLKLINKTGTENVSLDYISGQAIIDSTCVDGVIVIRGNCTVTNNSTGDCIVLDQTTLGLMEGNVRMINPSYNANGQLLSATYKVFDNKTDAQNNTNPIKVLVYTATYDENGNNDSYKSIEV